MLDKKSAKLLEQALDSYIKDRAVVVKSGLIGPELVFTGPDMATLATAYISLSHQQRQDRTNFILQALLGLVALTSLVSSVATLLHH